MARIRLALIVAVAIVGVLVDRLGADVIELKNGQRIEGTLKQADQSTVTVEVGGQSVTLKAGQVKAIYYGTAAGTTPAAGTTTAPSPATAALRALKDLQSVVKGGVSFRDYGPRVTNANIEVDRFLETPISGDEEVRSAFRDAIAFYHAAGHLWSVKMRGTKGLSPAQMDLEFPGDAVLFNKCPGTQTPTKNIITLDINNLTAKGQAQWQDPLSALWNCASERAEAAAKAIGSGR